MTSLDTLVADLDTFFALAESGADPAFSRFLPTVYAEEAIPWQSWTEPAFGVHFNGLMLRGDASVGTVFLSAFPSDEVLTQFLAQATPGDLLFLHHPINMESGDPRGAWGRFFQPIPLHLRDALQRQRLSVYSCHAPLDYHPTLSTSRAIATALGGEVCSEFFPYGPGYAGVLAEIAPISTTSLDAVLCRTFGVPYLDIAGASPAEIRVVAIVAGAGDRVDQMRDAEARGAHAYISGEIRSRIDSDVGRTRFAAVEAFARETTMALFGVSHAASEFLVMQTAMRQWFTDRYPIPTVLLPESHWWR